MQTIWGFLDQIEKDSLGTWWVQMRALLPGGSVVRVRVLVGMQTVVARGIARVDLSALRAGEVLEVSYHQGRDGLMEADTIYVRPEQVPVP